MSRNGGLPFLGCPPPPRGQRRGPRAEEQEYVNGALSVTVSDPSPESTG